jgi:hypothetical protein
VERQWAEMLYRAENDADVNELWMSKDLEEKNVCFQEYLHF